MLLSSLGRTGMQVSRYCLGTMMFGARGNTDHGECERIIHAALDRGINFVDTADMYAAGESEEIVGRAMRGRRDEIILATKVYNRMGADPNEQGSSRRWIVREVEASLRRLQTDWIDLYQLHRHDHSTPHEETLAALNDLVHVGKVRSIGSSTFPAELLVESAWAAERRGLLPLACEQPPYSIFVRGVERSVLPTCESLGMGVIVWSPLDGGWLTGKYRTAGDIDMSTGRVLPVPGRFDPSRPGNQQKFNLLGRLDRIAADADLSLTALSMAFVVAHPAVTSAIIGPRTMTQLEGLLETSEVELDDDVLARVDTVVSPGSTVNEPDNGYEPPAITTPGFRRRPLGQRSAG